MSVSRASPRRDLAQRLSEAEATIDALLSGQVDAVVDPKSNTAVLVSSAQKALRESEARYRSIVETANEGIWTIDSRSKVTFVNRVITEMLGYQAAEMIGRLVFDFLPESPADRAAHEQRVEQSRKGVSEEVEMTLVRKDGSVLWALLKTSPIRDTDGRYVGTLAMMTDRTQRREAEEALRKSEEQYRQIVETTTDGIIKTDPTLIIVFANRRFAEMLGHEPQELIGASVFTFMNAAARAAATAAFERRKAGIRDAFDTTFRHKNGTDISVNVAGSPLVDEQGNYVGNLGVIRDITEQKKLQSQLIVSDRMASVGTLAAGVAHEINNPLAAVIVNLDYVAETLRRLDDRDPAAATLGPADAWSQKELRGALDDARDGARRAGLIVRDLKIFSRVPAEEPKRPVDVKAIMESSLRMAWNEIRHRARLVRDYGAVSPVAANEARVGQVFLNLIVNAAQAVPEGRAEHNEIRVSTRQEGHSVVIEVSDTGVGIPPEVIGRIFDAFFTTKEVGVGTGLGLAICQRLVLDMGGALTVASEAGKGTTFRVELPVDARINGRAPPMDTPLDATRRGRILVVDDERLVLRGIERLLSREHEIVTVVAAKRALALCAAGEKFDVILCDLMMPNMTGMDLHGELLRVAPDQAEKMVFLTGGAFTASARRFLTDSPKEHLEKPFEPAALRAVLQRHLSGRASAWPRAET